jgi:hypothetical protein
MGILFMLFLLFVFLFVFVMFGFLCVGAFGAFLASTEREAPPWTRWGMDDDKPAPR